ncbi:MAG TPA: hypothetical protein VJW20_20175 [Candidatus Angelobacter sp.]|nr:hypothetical protein [Candidatus Angelobacter sp.]
MRKWGALVTLFYALVVLLLIVPGAVWIAKGELLVIYKQWIAWFPIAIVIAGQALLLFLSVDTSFQRLKPRAHILVSGLVAGTLWALLSGAAIFALGFGIYGDRFGGRFLDQYALACWGALWAIWLVIFYAYFRNSSATITRVTSWLLKGSVLELLIAVPAHVAARRRHDCSAPAVTSFGIASGIAIMLLCFGPSVLLLYKKRMNEYAKTKAAGR